MIRYSNLGYVEYDPNEVYDPNNLPAFIPEAPEPPEWIETIPNMGEFDPADPSRGAIGDTNQLKAFAPNCGGVTARAEQDTVGTWNTNNPPGDFDPNANICVPPEAPAECPDPNDPNNWPDDGQEPSDPNAPPEPDGFLDFEQRMYVAMSTPEVDPQSFGDGSIEDLGSYAVGGLNENAPILPDTLDRNGDGIPDVYDGPAEWDDMPSSMYHARNVSGLGYGGDGRPGEVTSVSTSDYWGEDVGAGSPGNPGGPDGLIPAAGPLAYKIHGTNGFDAGNVMNLEFLTWRSEVNAPIRAVAVSNRALFAVDSGLNALLEITDRGAPDTYTVIGLMGVSDIMALSAAPGGNLFGYRQVLGSHNELYWIDRTDGHTELIGPIWDYDYPEYSPSIQDMTYNPYDGWIYATVDWEEFYSTELWVIDPFDGAAFWVANLGYIGCQGLAYDRDLINNQDIIYTVDRSLRFTGKSQLGQSKASWSRLPVRTHPKSNLKYELWPACT